MRLLRIVPGLCVLVLVVWPKFGTAEEKLTVWWARIPPSIEEISGGKLKVGDTITKDNVELVKDYMPQTYYLDTLDGAEWEITGYTPGEELMPQAMLKATKENVGKAVISPTGTVTMADGSFRPLNEKPDLNRGEKSSYARGAQLELRDTFVIEATPRIDYRYSKKILYVDAPTYWTSLGEFFDNDGKLLEQNSLWFQRDENEYGPFGAYTWVQMRNYQDNQATLFSLSYYVRNPPASLLDLKMFTLKHITTQSR